MRSDRQVGRLEGQVLSPHALRSNEQVASHRRAGAFARREGLASVVSRSDTKADHAGAAQRPHPERNVESDYRDQLAIWRGA